MTHDSQPPHSPANDNDRDPAAAGVLVEPSGALPNEADAPQQAQGAAPADEQCRPDRQQQGETGFSAAVRGDKERKAGRLNLRAVPDLPRDELHHARVLDLQDQVHRLARMNLRDGFLEEDPGPRSIFINAGVKLTGAYLSLMNAEMMIRRRLDRGVE